MRIVTSIHIGISMEEVFDFLTTPGNWPRWHPSSLRVTGAVDHSLDVGEKVIEHYRSAGLEGTATWTVRERAAPIRWVIDGVAVNGDEFTITYRLTGQADGTLFERELVFTKLTPREPPIDVALATRHFEKESAEALRRLKDVMEEAPG
jgi:polyketide cyclase/dehydrase/lipid transport protein